MADANPLAREPEGIVHPIEVHLTLGHWIDAFCAEIPEESGLGCAPQFLYHLISEFRHSLSKAADEWCASEYLHYWIVSEDRATLVEHKGPSG